MKIKLLMVFLMVMTVFYGCDDGGGSGPSTSKSDELLPMKIGNIWIYETMEYDKDGSLISSGQDTIRVISDTTFDSETYYQVADDSPYYINRDDGVHIYLSLGESTYGFFKYPASSGESYTIGDTKILVESVSVKISVDAGEFNCYKFSLTDQNGDDEVTSELYFCPGAGLIVQDIITVESGGSYNHERFELKSYSLK